MPHLDVFDPPLCCSSGVCGPSVDPLLAAFAADVDWLTAQGGSVNRYNLAQDPQAFLANPLVKDMLQREGDGCLPLVILNGEVVGRGTYPRRGELAQLAGLTASVSPAPREPHRQMIADLRHIPLLPWYPEAPDGPDRLLALARGAADVTLASPAFS